MLFNKLGPGEEKYCFKYRGCDLIALGKLKRKLRQGACWAIAGHRRDTLGQHLSTIILNNFKNPI